MSVTCRREDKARFEELGFRIESDEGEKLVIELIDEQANYGHSGKLPTDIPYTGWYGAGDNYGPGQAACDGREFVEVSATTDGFVVAWDYGKMEPRPESIEQIRRYLKIEEQVKELFDDLEPPKQHLFSPDTHTCTKCGIHADDDAVENSPCSK